MNKYFHLTLSAIGRIQHEPKSNYVGLGELNYNARKGSSIGKKHEKYVVL